MRRASVPGKVMLAGEYAVLLPGHPCLVAGVERRLSVEAAPAERWSVDTGKVRWTEGEPVPPEVHFVVAAIEAVRKNFTVPPQALTTFDDLHVGERKLGLGGSAAVTVGTVFVTAPVGTDCDTLWRLAHLVHRTAQGGRGSGADVAASVFGGVQRFQSEPHPSVTAGREDVTVHPAVHLDLVWTGTSARTAPRLLTWSDFVRVAPKKAALFGKLSTEAVDTLQRGLETADLDAIRAGVGGARAALRGLESELGLELETDVIRAASDAAWKAGASGKLSGAGGGDCAIVLTVGEDQRAAVTRSLKGLGLDVVPADWAATGAREESAVR